MDCAEGQKTMSTGTTGVDRWLASAIAACLLSACGTIPESYRPNQIGVVDSADSTSGLSLSIRPDRTTAQIGDTITFDVIIKNMGTDTVWLPSQPDILLTWTYPDGKRDNFIRDDDVPAAPPALSPLAPGEERLFKSVVRTYYFDLRGVTEFRARVSVAPSARAEHLAWAGDLASNGYGVMFAN